LRHHLSLDIGGMTLGMRSRSAKELSNDETQVHRRFDRGTDRAQPGQLRPKSGSYSRGCRRHPPPRGANNHQGGPVVPISPTQVTVENKTLSGTQMQPPLGDEWAESLKLAMQDLAQRLGVSVDGVTVAAVIGQEFSADAFYCRATKERIARDDPPAVITGFSILLHVSGRRYEYHASGQTVLFCRPLP